MTFTKGNLCQLIVKMETDKNKIEYSLVIPVFNEEGLINELYRRVTLSMERLGGAYEVIFVDDGSKDKTFSILNAIGKKDPRIKILSFSRNFGHHIAITAGLDFSAGRAVIMMDGDLQDPPEEIIQLNEKFREGYDIVCAIYRSRQDPLLKRVLGKLFYRVFRIVGKVSIPENSGIFRMMSREVVDSVKSCREYSRFIVGLIDWTGFSTAGVEIDRGKRFSGKAKYNFFKSLKLAAYAIISFSSFPLQLAAYLGFMFASLSFVAGVYLLVKKIFFDIAVSGYTSIIVSVLFLGGIQLIVLGVIGEYIGKIYAEVQGRPLYLLKRKVGFEK